MTRCVCVRVCVCTCGYLRTMPLRVRMRVCISIRCKTLYLTSSSRLIAGTHPQPATDHRDALPNDMVRLVVLQGAEGIYSILTYLFMLHPHAWRPSSTCAAQCMHLSPINCDACTPPISLVALTHLPQVIDLLRDGRVKITFFGGHVHATDNVANAPRTQVASPVECRLWLPGPPLNEVCTSTPLAFTGDQCQLWIASVGMERLLCGWRWRLGLRRSEDGSLSRLRHGNRQV